MTRQFTLAAALVAALATAGCTNPNDPGQRAAGGGLIGAGAGALLGGMIGGGRGAAIGAITGGAVGVATGVVTTPQAQPQPYYERPGPELK